MKVIASSFGAASMQQKGKSYMSNKSSLKIESKLILGFKFKFELTIRVIPDFSVKVKFRLTHDSAPRTPRLPDSRFSAFPGILELILIMALVYVLSMQPDIALWSSSLSAVSNIINILNNIFK